MRVFTDGSCTKNGQAGAKGGWAVWFPDNKDWSEAQRLPESDGQTNNRAELTAILKAAEILERRGCLDEDIVIYSDSKYCIDCLTKWIPGWVARGWKTADGSNVSNRDLIEDISRRLSRFKSHRFHHVRAHTGGSDDISRQNDQVDRMARGTIDETVDTKEVVMSAVDEILPGCPVRLLGPPVRATEVTQWMRDHLAELDASVIDHHLYLAFKELCAARQVVVSKKIAQKTSYVRAERAHLQISHIVIDKGE